MELTENNTLCPEEWTSNWVKKKLHYARVADANAWKIPLCHELLGARNGHVSIEGFTITECEEMLNGVCIS